MNSIIHMIITRQVEAYSRGALNIWTIYDRPTDFPDGFIARRWESDMPTTDCITGDLAEMRGAFWQCGLVCITRGDADDPKIVECWL